MDQLTTIQLSPEDASLFLTFQKRYLFMKVLESIGVFDLKSASIEVHFDNLGGIGSIDIHKHHRLP